MRLIDRPNDRVAPDMWPGLTLLAATVMLEAEAEPEPGQLAVAFNPCNRARYLGVELHKAILGQDMSAYSDGSPYETYSCWNDDYQGKARARLANMPDAQWQYFYKLACAAWWELLPDPSNNAFFYLNPGLTRKIRPDGKLPAWWDIDADPTSEIVLGQHAFRRHR